jgi:ABC-type phosphate transport system substrate-binding protein
METFVRQSVASLIVVSVSCWVSFYAPALSEDVVLGAGSTFVYPVLAKWAEVYEGVRGIRIDYQAVGSGVGIRQIKSKTVDFGASDAPLRPDELAAAGLMQFPIVVGGVVPVVNVEGIGPGQLRLTGSVLADIFLGKIAKWNAEGGKQTWPITGATFALIYKQQQRRLTAIEMLRFFDWSYRYGARLADELQYVPMPKDVVQMIESAWAEVTDAHGQPAWAEPTTAKH